MLELNSYIMKLAYFIFQKMKHGSKDTLSHTIYSIAIASLATGIATIIVSLLILNGFERKITEKMFNLMGHITITKYNMGDNTKESAFPLQTTFYKNWKTIPYISHVQSFTIKTGIIKTENEVQGIALKGIGEDFDTTRFQENIITGRFLKTNPQQIHEIMISKKLSDKLLLSLGQDIIIYFVQNPPRLRKCKIVGIYSTHIETFDDKLIFCNRTLIQKINNWGDSLISGYEVFIKKQSQLDQAEVEILHTIDGNLTTETTQNKELQFFDWLKVIRKNVIMLFYIILFVVGFNIMSVLFILIMERSYFIGVMQSLGASHSLIKNIFVLQGMGIIFKGILLGNTIGLTIGIIQYYFEIIPLDPMSYYIDVVPIAWDIPLIFQINIITALLLFLIILIPTRVITKLDPIKTIASSLSKNQ